MYRTSAILFPSPSVFIPTTLVLSVMSPLEEGSMPMEAEAEDRLTTEWRRPAVTPVSKKSKIRAEKMT